MSVNKYLSWHEPEWRRLWEAPSGPPHAILVAGAAGVGKSQFSLALAQRILCESARQPADIACGACPSCHLFASGNHPDFRHVVPEAEALAASEEGTEGGEKKKASAQILIQQIRQLEDFVYIGGHRSSRRVILIEPAEAMNMAAENSLLKILEEPPSGVCFILTSTRWRKLLPTIRSRCRTLMFGRAPADQAARWLAEQGADRALALLPLMGGAPVRAMEEYSRGRAPVFEEVVGHLLGASGDFLELAGKLEASLKSDNGLKMEELVGIVQSVLFDLAAVRSVGQPRFLSGRADAVRRLAEKADVFGILSYYNELLKMRALSNHPLNPRLFLDDMAARYLRAIAPTAR